MRNVLLQLILLLGMVMPAAAQPRSQIIAVQTHEGYVDLMVKEAEFKHEVQTEFKGVNDLLVECDGLRWPKPDIDEIERELQSHKKVIQRILYSGSRKKDERRFRKIQGEIKGLRSRLFNEIEGGREVHPLK